MYRFRKGKIGEASVIGVLDVLLRFTSGDAVAIQSLDATSSRFRAIA
jgi:hypothetical protein